MNTMTKFVRQSEEPVPGGDEEYVASQTIAVTQAYSELFAMKDGSLWVKVYVDDLVEMAENKDDFLAVNEVIEGLGNDSPFFHDNYVWHRLA